MIQNAESHIIESGNVELTVKIYRRPASETILLLHGGPGVPDEITEVRELLQNRMQVITFDQRGIGNNSAENCSFAIADYIHDLNSIATYFNLEKFHLFGHSWGGLYAQIYAGEFPDKLLSLFLCSPASGTGELWKLTEKEVFQYNRSRSSRAEWIGMGIHKVLGLLGSNSAYRRLFRQIIINYNKGYNVEPPDPEKIARINARAGRATRRAIKQHPPIKNFGHTPYPVMITYGESDAYGISQKYVAERFPNAQTTIIPASGHTPWKHNLKEFTKVLITFYQLP